MMRWIKRSSIDSHNAENAAVFAYRGSVETTFGFLTSNQFYLDIESVCSLFRDVSVATLGDRY